jgi:hypothetical protein
MVYFNATQYLHIGRPYKCKFYFTMVVWMFPNCKKVGFPRYCMCKLFCLVTRLFLCTCLRHQCQSFAFQHGRPPNVKIPRKKKKDRGIEMSLGTTDHFHRNCFQHDKKKHHASTSTTTRTRPPDYTRTLSNLPRTTFACVLFSVLPVPDWPFESPLALL